MQLSPSATETNLDMGSRTVIDLVFLFRSNDSTQKEQDYADTVGNIAMEFENTFYAITSLEVYPKSNIGDSSTDYGDFIIEYVDSVDASDDEIKQTAVMADNFRGTTWWNNFLNIIGAAIPGSTPPVVSGSGGLMGLAAGINDFIKWINDHWNLVLIILIVLVGLIIFNQVEFISSWIRK